MSKCKFTFAAFRGIVKVVCRVIERLISNLFSKGEEKMKLGIEIG